MPPRVTALLLGEPDPIIGKIFMPGGLWIQWSRWEAPQEFQDRFNAQSLELDRTKRAEILREMEDWMLTVDPGPLLVYYWSFRDQIVNKQIQNYHMPVSRVGAVEARVHLVRPRLLTWFR